MGAEEYNMVPVLFVVRGIPGSGKSTTADKICDLVYSADDYFVGEDGVYRFDGTKLKVAHERCQELVRYAISCGDSVAVANTFTQRWEMEPYLRMAAEYGSRVVVVDCFDGGMTDEKLEEINVHGVPLDGIRAMRARWEHDWRAGDPRPPWERK